MMTHESEMNTMTDAKGDGDPQVKQVFTSAKYGLGQVVKHRWNPFRGVIFDIDPEFSNTEEFWLSMPEQIRPKKEQPYYSLFAENDEGYYIAYVSEQNLELDKSGLPVDHPDIDSIFGAHENGQYKVELSFN